MIDSECEFYKAHHEHHTACCKIGRRIADPVGKLEVDESYGYPIMRGLTASSRIVWFYPSANSYYAPELIEGQPYIITNTAYAVSLFLPENKETVLPFLLSVKEIYNG